MRTRSSTFAAALAAALALGAAACGTDDDAAVTTVPSAPTVSAAPTTPVEISTTAASEAPAFPVTIEHAHGATTIERAPQRIVSVGYTDHEILLALGERPVAIRYWYGEHEYVWPWAEEALGDHRPEVLRADEFEYEKLVALDPDLIIGLQIGMEADEYALLSEIAPTIAHSADYTPWGTPWQVNTLTVGRAVGRLAAAEALVAEVEAEFAAVRDLHPEFDGVGLAYAGVYGSDTANFYVETNGSTRMKVLQDLGFVVPAELEALGTDGFYHDISAEQIEILDQDIVLWEPAVLDLLPAVEENPIYRTLSVATEDRDIFLTDPLVAAAMAHATVLSLPVVLDALVPELERAVANR